MKPPRFWYPDANNAGAKPADVLWPHLLSPLLLPLSGLYQIGAALHRACTRPYNSRVPVICIGNVVAGGAGKTPTSLALARLLQERGEKPVFVTRGYGGLYERSGGPPLCVDITRHGAGEVGDEALLLAAVAPTWVCRDRPAAMRRAETDGTIILMDDGFQNPNIASTHAVLVIDGGSGLGNGRVLPAGPLREPFDQACARATALLIIGKDQHQVAALTDLPVFQAHLRPVFASGFPRKGRFVGFAGIGRPEKFYATARDAKLNLVQTVDFPDHHVFTNQDIDHLRLLAEENGARLLTTEKDAVRLPPNIRSEVLTLPVRLVLDDPQAQDALMRLCFDLC